MRFEFHLSILKLFSQHVHLIVNESFKEVAAKMSIAKAISKKNKKIIRYTYYKLAQEDTLTYV